MDKKKNSLFFKYFRMFFFGLFLGNCLGLVLFLMVTDKYLIGSIMLGVISTIIVCVLATEYDFHLIFGFAMSLGLSFVAAYVFFLQTNNSAESTKMMAIVFPFFMINYAFLKLIRYTVKEIIKRDIKKHSK